MRLKRYKVVIRTQFGVLTTNCEAETPKEAQAKALATLGSWQTATSVDVEEVGEGLRRTIP